MRRFKYALELPAGALWLLPLLVIWVIYFSPRHVLSAQTAITGLLALGLLAWAVRRPDLSLLTLIVLLPFDQLLQAELWTAGLPGSVVYHLGAWKDVLALGVILAGARAFLAEGRRADTLDRIALIFVGFVALYALFGPEIVPGAPSATHIRTLGFRADAEFVLVLLGARHAPLGPRFARRAGNALLAVGAVVSAIGVYSAIFSSAWNHFVVDTVRWPLYQTVVMHNPPADPTDIRVWGSAGGLRIVRIGSVFLDELYLAWFLILPIAVGLERLVRRAASPLVLVATVLCGAALLLTQTRSAIVGALIVAVLGLKVAAGRQRHWRTKIVILLTGLAVLAIPTAFATGLFIRFEQLNNSKDVSTHGHESRFSNGVNTIAKHPLGEGLGTQAGLGERFGTDLADSENSYLNIGEEIGVLPMVIFAALMVTLLVYLRRAALRASDPLVTATWAAGVGLAVSAWFLHTWFQFSVTWTYWGMAGAMLGLARQRAHAAAPAMRPGAVPARTAVAAGSVPARHEPASSASR